MRQPEIMTKDQARLIAQAICSEIKSYCTANPAEYAAFVAQKNHSQRANQIDMKIKNSKELIFSNEITLANV